MLLAEHCFRLATVATPGGHCQDSVGVELAGFAAKLKQLTSGPLVCVGPFKALEEALVMCSHAHGIL